MMKRKINFYKYQIIVKDDIKLSFLDVLEDSNIEPQVINDEIIKIEDFKKTRFSDRFWGLYFQSGDLFNYSPKIIDTEDKLRKKKNPRKNTQIELDKQFFFLVDRMDGCIYLSDNKQKTFIKKWLSDKTGYYIELKIIIDEKRFKEKLDRISEINFTLKNERTLFNNTPLNRKLLDDLYNYEADAINVSLKYNQKITQRIRDRYEMLLGEKEHYKTIQIIGKDDKGVDLIFNPKGILSRISSDEFLENDTKKFKQEDVFNNLIVKITQYEKK